MQSANSVAVLWGTIGVISLWLELWSYPLANWIMMSFSLFGVRRLGILNRIFHCRYSSRVEQYMTSHSRIAEKAKNHIDYTGIILFSSLLYSMERGLRFLNDGPDTMQWRRSRKQHHFNEELRTTLSKESLWSCEIFILSLPYADC